MKDMNPKWGNSELGSSIDLDNEHQVSWLCDPAEWTNYVAEPATYAIGSPSVEMFMKSFNIYKNNDIALINKIGISNGYKVGAFGAYGDNDYGTEGSTIDDGRNNMYKPIVGHSWWWLASPSCAYSGGILHVRSYAHLYTDEGYQPYGLSPIVAIQP